MRTKATISAMALLAICILTCDATAQVGVRRRRSWRQMRRTQPETSKIRQKLETIMIPKVEFEEASIADVIRYLQRVSKEADPEGKGVNILLYLKQGRKTEAAVVTPIDRGEDWGKLLKGVQVEVIEPPKQNPKKAEKPSR